MITYFVRSMPLTLHCMLTSSLHPQLTCERQCGAVHSHCSITSLTHITAIVWSLKVINNKWWGGRQSTAGAPDANVGRFVDKSHSTLCPGDGCSCWVCCTVQPDHRLLHNIVYPTIVLKEGIWERSDCQLDAHIICIKKQFSCSCILTAASVFVILIYSILALHWMLTNFTGFQSGITEG